MSLFFVPVMILDDLIELGFLVGVGGHDFELDEVFAGVAEVFDFVLFRVQFFGGRDLASDKYFVSSSCARGPAVSVLFIGEGLGQAQHFWHGVGRVLQFLGVLADAGGDFLALGLRWPRW